MWLFKHYFSHKGRCVFIFSSVLTNTSKIQIGRICRKESAGKKVGFGLQSDCGNCIVLNGINFMILIYKSYLMQMSFTD